MQLCFPGTGDMNCPLFLTLCQMYIPSFDVEDLIEYAKCEVSKNV